MPKHKVIYLQPEECADPYEGQHWCRDNDPFGPCDCPDGPHPWIKYVLAEDFGMSEWITHDGGGPPSYEVVYAEPGKVEAKYRKHPERPVKLFMPALEQWEWVEGNSEVDIIAYRFVQTESPPQ